MRKIPLASSLFAFPLFAVLFIAHGTAAQRTSPEPTPTHSDRQCNCSAISILSNSPNVKMGDTAELYLVTNDIELLKSTFEWTVSMGQIVSGQGTSKITVLISNVSMAANSGTDNLVLPPGFVRSDLPQSIITSGRPRPRNKTLTVTAKPSGAKICDCSPASVTLNVQTLPFVVNQPANIEDLTLDRSEITLSCKPGQAQQAATKTSDPIINVSTVAKDPENDVLTYQYTVSGGKIVGQGANVQWDLSDVQPGLYTITAGADDGCGICGKTKTQEVYVRVNPDCGCGLINCPTLSLSEPTRTEEPGIYVITANISGGSQDSPITYHWSITNGEIVTGQGGPSVNC